MTDLTKHLLLIYPFSACLHTIQGIFYSPIGVPKMAHLGE